MTWRVARSLLKLRDQINERYPNRSKVSDGTIGDADHRNRNSDHNPWFGPGIVTAIDITHDPANGVDIDRLSDELAASRDPRIKYIIANGLILDSRPQFSPWTWQPYRGSNPHTRHLHLSVMPNASCDDERPWDLPMLTGTSNVEPEPSNFSIPQYLYSTGELPMKLEPGKHAASFGEIPPGATHICIEFPRGTGSARVILHGDKNPNTYKMSPKEAGVPDFDWKLDKSHDDIDRLRSWRIPIPEGATGGAVYWTYEPDDKYDTASGSLTFRFKR